jgi:hypothetical protein
MRTFLTQLMIDEKQLPRRDHRDEGITVHGMEFVVR